ncbi:MAG: Rossman fold protein, TIGR00730 family [Acidobacteria bacterium RIFCSPLOWO2_12_FULL_54_10]|nr:MAG: Rossman fold protein, TIGR00730 family [Acidobacteria bacterium RIFCSPLOWO2_12_FULL_54_10]
MSKHPNNPRRPVAYRNDRFLDSSDARPLRILSEYLEPLSHFRREGVRDTIVFFGSARAEEGNRLGKYYNDAQTLATQLTAWSEQLPAVGRRFVVCTGGGPGIMEAANRGALEANGKTIGLNIGLTLEQWPNPYITPELSFEFHYFFMRKFWFAYLAKAMVFFPGGFGTMDELMEVLTLVQTKKLNKKIIIVLYGSKFWNDVIDFESLVRHETISREDLDLFQFADDPETAFRILQDGLTKHYLHPEIKLPEPPKAEPDI